MTAIFLEEVLVHNKYVLGVCTKLADTLCYEL